MPRIHVSMHGGVIKERGGARVIVVEAIFRGNDNVLQVHSPTEMNGQD